MLWYIILMAFLLPSHSGLIRGFERLVRKLLDRRSLPAVLLLNHHKLIDIDEKNVNHPYLDNADAFYFEVSTYYGIPSASLKAAMWSLAQRMVPGFWVRI
jgi:hypothetical protein